MQISGNLKLVKSVQQITEKFSKREFVIVTNEQYAQTILLELQGQNCDIIDAYAEGQGIICNIEFKGRVWTNPQGEDKYFNTIVCTGIQPTN
jgi:single-strand DNA-binding protein